MGAPGLDPPCVRMGRWLLAILAAAHAAEVSESMQQEGIMKLLSPGGSQAGALPGGLLGRPSSCVARRGPRRRKWRTWCYCWRSRRKPQEKHPRRCRRGLRSYVDCVRVGPLRRSVAMHIIFAADSHYPIISLVLKSGYVIRKQQNQLVGVLPLFFFILVYI